MADITEGDKLFLLPCSICSRTFRSEVLERHEKVCEKTKVKKRKVFNSFKARVQGTELEEFLGPAPLPTQVIKPPKRPPAKAKEPKTPKWKQTHEALLATLRAARGKEPASSVSLTAALGEQCPTCGRYFGPSAYDRHVTFCREVTSRKPASLPKSNPAKERLERRTKYQAPLIKGKTRATEHFVPKPPNPVPPSPTVKRRPSTTSQRKPSQPSSAAKLSPTSTIPSPKQPRHASATVASRASSTSSTPSSTTLPSLQQKNSTGSFTRSAPIRGSMRLRSVSPTKSTVSSSTLPSPKQQSPTKSLASKSKDQQQRPSSLKQKVDEPINEALEAITQAADRQMLALLSCPSAANLAPILLRAPTPQPKSMTQRSSPSPTLPVLKTPTSPRNSSPLHASPTSAFSPLFTSKTNDNDRYFDVNKNEMFVQGKNEWNTSSAEQSVPVMVTSTPLSKRTKSPSVRSIVYDDDIPSQRTFSVRDIERNRRNSELSVSSQPSDSTLADEGITWSQIEALHPPVQLKKSRKKTFARSQSVFEDRNRMLFSLTCAKKESSSDEEDIHSYKSGFEDQDKNRRKFSNSRPKASTVYRRSQSPFFEEMERKSSAPFAYSRLCESPLDDLSYDRENRRSSTTRPNLFAPHNRPKSPYDDEDVHGAGKDMACLGGGDSAYSSLTRRSPKTAELISEKTAGHERKMSVFCHECGSKFPLTAAKFCCECGVKRLCI